jgi:addiction module RelE/StbE family toxin
VKPVVYRKQFKKNLHKCILPNSKLAKQFEQRLKLFTKGVRDYPVDDHALVDTMRGLRAFSIGGDLRVVYRETEECYELLDIGSHNQVY